MKSSSFYLSAASTLALLFLPPTLAVSGEPFFEQQDLFVSGAGVYHTVRRPAIAVTNKGTVLAFCQAHRFDDSDIGDIDIVLRRSFDGGKTWGEPQIVWNEEMNSCFNPTVVVDRETGRIWALFGWNAYSDTLEDVLSVRLLTHKPEYRANIFHSSDDGETWSPLASIQHITGQFKEPEWRLFRPGAGAGIQLQKGPHKGRLMFPCVLSSFGKHCGYEGFHNVYAVHDYVHFGAYVVYSDDHGNTWRHSDQVVWPWMGESQIVELSDGRLMLNMQTYFRKDKCRAVSISEDGGDTWTEATFDTTLVDPVSQAGFVQYTSKGTEDKDRLLFSNPADPDQPRNLTVRLSYDNGQFWPVKKVVEPGEAENSALAVLHDKSIGLLYEQGSDERIRFARFNLEWLTDGADFLPPVPQGGLVIFENRP